MLDPYVLVKKVDGLLFLNPGCESKAYLWVLGHDISWTMVHCNLVHETNLFSLLKRHFHLPLFQGAQIIYYTQL